MNSVLLFLCSHTHDRSQQRFKALVDNDPSLRGPFRVPAPVPELSSKRVLTSELVPGVPIDKVALLDQKVRDEVGTKLLRLTLKELFEWRFMQTDPNWGNFLYDTGTCTCMRDILFIPAFKYPSTSNVYLATQYYNYQITT